MFGRPTAAGNAAGSPPQRAGFAGAGRGTAAVGEMLRKFNMRGARQRWEAGHWIS